MWGKLRKTVESNVSSLSFFVQEIVQISSTNNLDQITIQTRSRMLFWKLVSDWSRQITWPGPWLVIGHLLFLNGDHPGRKIFILPSLVWMNVLLKYFLSNSDIWLSWSPSNCVKTLMRLFKVPCLLKPSKFEFTYLPKIFVKSLFKRKCETFINTTFV